MRRIIALLSVLSAISTAATGQPVPFRDPGLKAAVKAQLHVTKPLPADVLRLAYLVASEREIADLTGLASLKELDLSNNRISDIAPLLKLTRLTKLSIEYDNPLNPAACRRTSTATGSSMPRVPIPAGTPTTSSSGAAPDAAVSQVVRPRTTV